MRDHKDDIVFSAAMAIIVLFAVLITFLIGTRQDGEAGSVYLLLCIWLFACGLAVIPTKWYADRQIK